MRATPGRLQRRCRKPRQAPRLQRPRSARCRAVGGSCGYLLVMPDYVGSAAPVVAGNANRYYVKRLGVIAMIVMSCRLAAINAPDRSVELWNGPAPYGSMDFGAGLQRNIYNLVGALVGAVRGVHPSAVRDFQSAICALFFAPRRKIERSFARRAFNSVSPVRSAARCANRRFRRSSGYVFAHAATSARLLVADPSNRSGRSKRKYISRAFGIPYLFQSETDGCCIPKMRATSAVPPSSLMSLFVSIPAMLGAPKHVVKGCLTIFRLGLPT